MRKKEVFIHSSRLCLIRLIIALDRFSIMEPHKCSAAVSFTNGAPWPLIALLFPYHTRHISFSLWLNLEQFRVLNFPHAQDLRYRRVGSYSLRTIGSDYIPTYVTQGSRHR